MLSICCMLNLPIAWQVLMLIYTSIFQSIFFSHGMTATYPSSSKYPLQPVCKCRLARSFAAGENVLFFLLFCFVQYLKKERKQLTILPTFFSIFLLCWGLTTRQPLWVILCRLPEKGRKEIEELVEEMKERNREERGTGMKEKKQKK